MRLSAISLAVLGVASATARSVFGGTQATLDDDLKIPGDSPLELCPKDHSSDILTITKVDLTPNPPLAYVALPFLSSSRTARGGLR